MLIQSATAAPPRNLAEARKGPLQPVPQSDRFTREDQQATQEAVATAVRRVMNGETTPGVQFADTKGRVKHLALMISDAYVQGKMREQVLGAYHTLFTRMEPDTKFTVVAATDKDKADVQNLLADVPNPERVQILEPGLPSLTVWARDMMVPKFMPGDPAHTALIAQEPLHNWHLDDSQVPAHITDANPSILLEDEKGMITDGGDTQSNSRESFVGFYSLAATENKLQKGLQGTPLKSEVIAWYEQKTGKKVVETDPKTTFRYRFEPATASDGTEITRMVPNPDYKEAVVGPNEVSDAQMYDDLAVSIFRSNLNKPVTIMGRDNPKTAHVEEPASDHMDMSMTPVDDNTFFVGDPSLAHEILGTAPDRNRDNQEDFDAYAKTLTDKGYSVIRLPHLEPSEAGAPYLTYNNCLAERFEKDGEMVRRVFLPQYGIEKLDSAARNIWESQGFEVIPMPLDQLSAYWGALRCISNWLDRSDNAA